MVWWHVPAFFVIFGAILFIVAWVRRQIHKSEYETMYFNVVPNLTGVLTATAGVMCIAVAIALVVGHYLP